MPYSMLIDANNVIMRSAMDSAQGDLQAGGVYTGGVYGALRTILGIIKQPDMRPDAIVAFFDGGIPKRRLTLIPEFKAERLRKRAEASEEEKAEREKIVAQIDLTWEMLGYLGVTTAQYEDREADDCLGTASRLLGDGKALVVSGDHDLYQTVRFGAAVWDPGLRKIINPLNFAAEVGIPAGTFLLYRTLTGDKSDEVRGAGGVGPKKATALIQEMRMHYDTMSHGGFDFEDEEPLGQLTALVNYLNNPAVRKKRAVHEDNIIQNYTRLQRVMQGIDISDSFGSVELMKRKLAEVPSKPDKLRFLGFCKRLKFMSVLGSPDQYFRPFQEVYDRRLAAHGAGGAC
jgi:DNA polymerase-1